MSRLLQFEITAAADCWKGYAAIARGDGHDVSAALKDAASLIGQPYRPKQSGTESTLLNVSMRRPDGTCFNIHPHKLKECFSPADLEAAKEP